MKLTEIYAARRAERMQNLGEVKDVDDPDINLKQQLADDDDDEHDDDVDESELQK